MEITFDVLQDCVCGNDIASNFLLAHHLGMQCKGAKCRNPTCAMKFTLYKWNRGGCRVYKLGGPIEQSVSLYRFLVGMFLSIT